MPPCSALEACIRAERERRRAGLVFEREQAINRNVCHLCRLLFTPTNSSEPLRPPLLGGLIAMPYESMDPTNWPDLPFVIFDDIPLSMSLGYASGGLPEMAESYLAYCKANGKFRTLRFAQPDAPGASNALHQVFSSPAWKALKWKDEGLGWRYTLDQTSAKRELWQQIDNMANRVVQRTGASRSAQETNRASSTAGSRR